VLALAWALLMGMVAYADLSISVLPVQGGPSLRFNQSDVLTKLGQEIRVRVTSTEAVQYQVYHRWVQPLRSVSGQETKSSAVNYYGISGSNGSGTLYGQIPEFLSLSDQLVYSSAGDGTSDSFVLAYQVDPQQLGGSGQYYGKLLFTVRPIGSGQVQEAYLDVFVDAELGFNIAIVGERGGQDVEINTGYEDQKTDQVDFSFSGNAGTIRIYQQVLDPIYHLETNAELPLSILTMATEGTPGDIKIPDAEPLRMGQTLLYESNSLEDQWRLIYALTNTGDRLAAGTYQGRIRYTVEAGGVTTDYDFMLRVIVARIFTLDLDFPENGIYFSKLLPGAPPQTHAVDVRVNSNLGKPYVVWQKSNGLLRNDENEDLKKEHFLVKVILSETTIGREAFPEFAPVPEGETPIFFSDEKGSPAEFEVQYRVEPYMDMSPGDYRTEMTFTLSEI